MSIQHYFPAGNPLEDCPTDPGGNGAHDWVPLGQSGTGPPRPNARFCMNCDAVDYGPEGLRKTIKDRPPLFPAGTNIYKDIVTHDPDR